MRINFLFTGFCFLYSCGGNSGTGQSGMEVNPRFARGERVDVLHSGAWKAGTVEAFEAARHCYRIRFDDSLLKSACITENKLRSARKSMSDSPSMDYSDVYGTWELNRISEKKGSVSVSRELPGGGSVTINADGSYSWAMAGELITGSWNLNPDTNAVTQGPVHIGSGWKRKQWWLQYFGRNAEGKLLLKIYGEDGRVIDGYR